MNINEVLPFLNNISNALIGREFRYGEHRPYSKEIDSLIEVVGFDEFFKDANLNVKIEFLSVCNEKNFNGLIQLLSLSDFLNIIIFSEVGDLREILKKLLVINNEWAIKYWDFLSGNINEIERMDDIDVNKRLLLQGYLSEYKKRKSLASGKNKSESEKEEKEEVEKLYSQFNKLLLDYDQLKEKYAYTVSELNLHMAELEEKNKENIQNRIDENLSDYVEKSVAALNRIEKKLKCAAARWSALSVIILFSGFAAGIGFALFGYKFGPDLKYLKWPEMLIFSIKGIFIVSAFVAAAGYSFMKSNAFTHEAIIVSNRAHAIQFGKLYLEIYGNTVERSEMQKIFENWNISSDTAFLKHKTDKSESVKFDALLDSLKKVKELIPSIGKE